VYIVPENTASFAGFISGKKWAGGLVRYRFHDKDAVFSEAAKKTAREAMAEWKEKTGNRVRFEEMSPTAWDMICKGIGQTQYLTIQHTNGVNDSTVGSVAISRINISPNHATEKRTYLHELGHTLGLMHEHQRHDRDNYVMIDSVHLKDNVNYGIIPEKTVVAGLKPVKILFITIYLPYIWYVDYGKTVGSFDFNSVMLYATSNDARIYRRNPLSNIARNTAVSAGDAQTIRNRY